MEPHKPTKMRNIFLLSKIVDTTYFSYKFNLIAYFLLTLSFCLLIAITDEYIQGLTNGRAKSVGDVFIDFGGCLAAVILIFILKYKKIKSTLNID